MSRFTVHPTKPIFGKEVDEVCYGLDHACGYFIQGFVDEECVFDRDTYGLGLAGDDALVPLTRHELATALNDLGRPIDAELVTLDLPPEGH